MKFMRSLRPHFRKFSLMHKGVGGERETRKMKFGSQWRYFFRWRSSIADRNPILDHSPWMTFEAIDFLDSWIRSDHEIFEWGSGGSTLFFRERAKKVVSLEHDAQFFENTDDAIPNHSNLHERILLPPSESSDDGYAGPYESSVVPNRSFEKYVRFIERYPDESFDLISVDGRARVSCFRAAIKKLKPRGILVLDNSERNKYQQCFTAAKDLVVTGACAGAGPYNRYFWETTIFTKGK